LRPTVAFHTLGCKVNYYETEALKGQFRREGFELVDFHFGADVYVFNTCTVTHLADRKSRQAIRRAKRKNPQALVAVIGCYAQVQPEDLAALKEVDLLQGTAHRMNLPGRVKQALAGEQPGEYYPAEIMPSSMNLTFEEMPWQSQQGRTRAFLKIQDGCDRFCSYCIVPLARGPLRSLPPSRVLHYLQEIANAGYREVVLTGIHLGLYGVDLQPAWTLADLLEEIRGLAGIMRIRLSSLEPADISEQLVDVLKSDGRFCPHLHIPLQSGDDQILEAMGRPYRTMQFSYLVQYLKNEIQDLAISSDVIVGFPGEDERNFQNTLRFVEKCGFSRLHVFKFSPRRGTRAAQLSPQVPYPEKEKRSRQMMALGEELSRCYQDRFLGKTLPVLLESPVQKEAGLEQRERRITWEGLTPNYLRVQLSCEDARRGELYQAEIRASYPGYLLGSRVGDFGVGEEK